MQTPWGPAQSVSQIAPGIISVTTASHGGFGLSPQRWSELISKFPLKSYADQGWLEEDMDWAVAPIVWPDEFKPVSVYYAVRTVQDYRSATGDSFYFFGARPWLNSPAGVRARQIAAEYAKTVSGMWEIGGAHGDRSGWTIYFHRNGQTKTGFFDDYPKGNWFTDAQIEGAVKRHEALKQAA